ncbi:hypothetical protein [Methylocystis parvus]|jgi:hypothetical protein|uniref:hypothetical protein n=1 Tax=Methylocystis parvus TaxID=134 RepID=UPI003C754203
MFDAILKLAAQGRLLSVTEVERELAISPEAAESLFLELERRGYLKRINSTCSTPCGDCPAKEGCRFLRSPRLWIFTEKGQQAARF